MDEDGQPLFPQRSLSQNSTTSTTSAKTRAIKVRPRKSGSGSSNSASIAANLEEDKSLTSFPSLSPENSPHARRNDKKSIPAPVQTASTPEPSIKKIKATLAGLTKSSPTFTGRAALFDDPVKNSHDVPGALHHASDEHIERLIAKTGAVNLVRQFARDLAHRDAEISALRVRATEREKELKRMLREVEVSNMAIEMRLYNLEKATEKNQEFAGEEGMHRPGVARRPTASIDDMMNQAMLDDVGFEDETMDGIVSPEDPQATIRPSGSHLRNGSDARSGNSSIDMTARRGSIKGVGEYLWGSNAASRKTSRSSSVHSIAEEDVGDTARPRAGTSSTTRRKVLDDSLFQPPSNNSTHVGISKKKAAALSNNSDESDAQSRKSSRSISAWTVKLFAGNPQASKEPAVKESDDPKRPRGRAASVGQGKSQGSRPASIRSQNTTHSAMASLAKIQSRPTSPLKPMKPGTNGTTKAPSQPARPSLPTVSASPDSTSATLAAANYGPVEMDQILPMNARPPTLIHTYSGFDPTEVLTDRFGFIYDQRRKKRQREAASGAGSNRLSGLESIGGTRKELEADDDQDQTPKVSRDADSVLSPQRPATPASFDDQKEKEPTRRWQDYLRTATRPTELLSHTPSAGPILSLTTGDASDPETRQRSTTISVGKQGSLPSAAGDAQTAVSNITSGNSEFASSTSTPDLKALSATEQEPVKMLLDQLTDVHDSLQREKTVKWNEFLRKVRAERKKEGDSLLLSGVRSIKALMPETSLTDGEIIGISSLGNKGKVGRAKWKEFRTLVLGGIPVSLRPKIWAECSGASALRVPGYYDDLVNNTSSEPIDPTIVAQIQMDINRTLTDNVFFRKGPGVAKLNEVLLAYARRNTVVGYCQGMNLITAYLLLIMPTAEDAFWILTSMVENILPAHYYDGALLASRADQQVLRQYVAEVLPRLSVYLDDLGVELEALTFQWFLSIFTDCLSAEALYRVWDVFLCLNAAPPAMNTSISLTNPPPLGLPMPPLKNQNPSSPTSPTFSKSAPFPPTTTDSPSQPDPESESQGSTIFLHAVSLALLKLNEAALLAADSPAAIYSYINHDMTNHAISIDGLINASEALGRVVPAEEVKERRAKVMREMTGGSVRGDAGSMGS
jgi:small G protein signaling modulator 3